MEKEGTDLNCYKPKHEILSLSDDEIALWYGKNALEFVRDIQQYTIELQIVNTSGRVDVNYIGGINNDIMYYYIIKDKHFRAYNTEILITQGIKKIIKDLFNYEIDLINEDV